MTFGEAAAVEAEVLGRLTKNWLVIEDGVPSMSSKTHSAGKKKEEMYTQKFTYEFGESTLVITTTTIPTGKDPVVSKAWYSMV